MRGKSSNPIRGHRRSALVALVTVVAAAAFGLTAAGCDRQRDNQEASKATAPSGAAAKPATALRKYAYGDWSDWQLDCSQRMSEPNRPCAAVRKRVCQVEGTQEGVACEYCGGKCKQSVADDKSTPLHIYAPWSGWQSGCNACDPEPRACKAERTRICLHRVTGNATDCEFCGGACKEQEDRMSSCTPECKWTRVHSYADKACTLEVSDDIFAGQWGPQTNSPFNAGCSETQWSEKCVQFGRNYYKWESCTPGCTPPLKK